MNQIDRSPVVESPQSCPFCRSPHVVATVKHVTDATYWRCETCGEMWHPARTDVPKRRPW